MFLRSVISEADILNIFKRPINCTQQTSILLRILLFSEQIQHLDNTERADWGWGVLRVRLCPHSALIRSVFPQPGSSQLYPSITEAPGTGLRAPKPTEGLNTEKGELLSPTLPPSPVTCCCCHTSAAPLTPG